MRHLDASSIKTFRHAAAPFPRSRDTPEVISLVLAGQISMKSMQQEHFEIPAKK